MVPDTVSITAPRRGTTSGAGRRHPAQSSDGGCLRLHIRSSIGQHLSESARTGTNDDSLVVEAIDIPDGDPDWTVRGLRLPEPLVHLLAAGRWRDSDERALRRALPWFEDPLIFLSSVRWMRRESESLDREVDDEPSAGLFRLRRGSRELHPVELPWLDVEQAILVAVNRNPGDDVAVALDYRTAPADPRVVASDFWTNPAECSWRVVSQTFTEFATLLELQ